MSMLWHAGCSCTSSEGGTSKHPAKNRWITIWASRVREGLVEGTSPVSRQRTNHRHRLAWGDTASRHTTRLRQHSQIPLNVLGDGPRARKRMLHPVSARNSQGPGDSEVHGHRSIATAATLGDVEADDAMLHHRCPLLAGVAPFAHMRTKAHTWTAARPRPGGGFLLSRRPCGRETPRGSRPERLSPPSPAPASPAGLPWHGDCGISLP